MEIFQSPRVLPCQHILCRNCLSAMINKLIVDSRAKGTCLKCPMCRRKYQLDNTEGNNVDHHLEKFPESLLLKTLLECRENHTVQKQDVCVGTNVKKTTSSSQTDHGNDAGVTGVTNLFYIRICRWVKNLSVYVASTGLKRLVCLWKFRKYILYFILFMALSTTLLFMYLLSPTVAVPVDIQRFKIDMEQQFFYCFVLLPVICGVLYITAAYLNFLLHEIYTMIRGAMKAVADMFTNAIKKVYPVTSRKVAWSHSSGEDTTLSNISKFTLISCTITLVLSFITILYLPYVLDIFVDLINLCFGLTWITAFCSLAVLITVKSAVFFHQHLLISNLERNRVRRQHSRRGKAKRVYIYM